MIKVETIREINGVLKQANRLDLAEHITELREELITARENNMNLKEELSNLREQFKIKQQIIFEKGICWIKDDELTEIDENTPICPECWHINGVVNRQKIIKYEDGPGFYCNKCKMVYIVS